MSWGWLKAILSALFDWRQKQAEKPKTTQDANTPPEIADRNADAFRDWKRLRDKSGDGH